MKAATITAALPLLAALAAVGVIWYLTRPGAAGEAGQAAGHAAVEAADGLVGGVIVGLGELMGIPATDADQCTLDLARGDLWAASFSCPAPRYLKAVSTGSYGATTTGHGAEGKW